MSNNDLTLYMIEFDYPDAPWFLVCEQNAENALFLVYERYPYLQKVKTAPSITPLTLEPDILYSSFGDPNYP
jgi:hypothetical protein